MHNSDVRFVRGKWRWNSRCVFFFPQSHSRGLLQEADSTSVIPSETGADDFRWWFSTHTCAHREGIFRRKSRTLVYNKPLFFVPFFLLLSRICGHRVRKSSSAIFCNSYPTRSRAPRIESHRLGKSSSVIFYNVCTLHSRACPSVYLSTYLPRGLEWRYYAG